MTGTAEPFAHLQVASAFSAHYGVSWPAELVQAAAADGQRLLACTDRDGLYGMAKHVSACREHGIAPIVGVDLAVTWADLAPGERAETEDAEALAGRPGLDHLPHQQRPARSDVRRDHGLPGGHRRLRRHLLHHPAHVQVR